MDFIQGNKHLSIDPSGIVIKGSDNLQLLQSGNITIEPLIIIILYPYTLKK